MEIKLFDRLDENCTHIIRVLSPLGTYPRHTIKNNGSSLYISDDICFSIVNLFPLDAYPEDYYSEVEWGVINEIKFYSSIALSINWHDGNFVFYPLSKRNYIKYDDDINNDLLQGIASVLTSEIIQSDSEVKINPSPSFSDQRKRGVILPPISRFGSSYVQGSDGIDLKLQEEIFTCFDNNDFLMVRGIATLLRSRMLSVHYHFLEEAINTLFISLDASFSLVLRELEIAGVKNPSSKDAAIFLAKKFNCEASDKYFEYYYEQRIRTFHPKSRFGISPHAPLMVDDFCDLVDDLTDVYRFLLCGKLPPNGD